MRLGIVTGLADEAACVPAAADVAVACAGPGPARAADAARAVAAQGAQVLISFGVAGALARIVRPGQLVLPEAVAAPDGRRVAAWPALRSAVMAAGLAEPLHQGLLAGSDVPVLSRAAKQQLRQATGAMAVDMESHAVAAVAGAAGLPFLALRAIVDAADEPVPALALAGMGEDGSRRVWPVIRGLALRPWDLPRLLRLGGQMQAALAALRRAAPILLDVGGRA